MYNLYNTTKKQIFDFSKKSRGSLAVRDNFIAKHKFYLAFENSLHCNDYISEKFWRNALGNGAVPIVYGPHINGKLKKKFFLIYLVSKHGTKFIKRSF